MHSVGAIFYLIAFVLTYLTTAKGAAQCGRIQEGLLSTLTLVVGGRAAVPHSWPWIGALNVRRSVWRQDWHYQCVVSLIQPKWALTAAHCLSFQSGEPIKPGQMAILFGAQDVTKHEREQTVAYVRSIVKHHDFDHSNFANDIALLELSNPLPSNHLTSPICLPTVDDQLNQGDLGVITGWGRISETGPYADDLQEVYLPVTETELCKNVYKSMVSDHNHICAGFLGGEKDACQGDSGGPYAFQKNGRWVQMGIVSFGEGCARKAKLGVYTKVASYLTWIYNITAIS